MPQRLKLNLTAGFKVNKLFSLARGSDRSTMHSYLSMKMGWVCSFVNKGTTSSDVSRLKLYKFNLERSNFLTARIIKHQNKLVGGVRHLPLFGVFKTSCLSNTLWSSSWEKKILWLMYYYVGQNNGLQWSLLSGSLTVWERKQFLLNKK